MAIIQTSCSELLVDTAIHDPRIAFDRFTKLFRISYNTKILQYEEVGQFLCQLKQTVPLP